MWRGSGRGGLWRTWHHGHVNVVAEPQACEVVVDVWVLGTVTDSLKPGKPIIHPYLDPIDGFG